MPSATSAPVLSFKQSSVQAAKRFLQTAMLFDDHATFVEQSESVSAEDVTTPSSMGPEELTMPQDELVSEGRNTSGVLTEPTARGENLYAKAINDAFAAEGIVCGVIKPIGGDTKALEAIKIAAKRADIVVVDWSIDNDQGETALNVIEGILTADKTGDAENHKGRLRLLAIYTFESDLAAIADKVKSRLPFKELSTVPGDIKGKYTLSLDNNVRLCLYQKDRGSVRNLGPNKDRVVSDDKLPERLIEDFSDMTSGLLFNLVLTALGAIRENTHRLLQRFSASMDAPYFTHRVLSDPMNDTQEHPVTLLTSEIEDILFDCSVAEVVNTQAVSEWLDSISVDRDLSWDGVEKSAVLQSLKDLSAEGMEKFWETNQASLPRPLKALYKKLLYERKEDRTSTMTNLLLGGGNTAAEDDRNFAVLTTFRSHYVQPPPQLKLGAVLGRKNDMNEWEYLVCIQPVCDATRLKAGVPHVFPFLRIVDPARGIPPKPAFNLIFVHREITRRLKIAVKPSQIVLHTFESEGTHQAVVANLNREGDTQIYWTFTTTGTEVYEWIGELRFPHAQRVAANLAAELSRVGLTESEWLRRAAR